MIIITGLANQLIYYETVKKRYYQPGKYAYCYFEFLQNILVNTIIQ